MNSTMRTITGTIRSTPLPWLPALANIAPPHIRRVVRTQRMLQKTKDSPHLPIHMDIFNPPTARLPSRRPIWKNPPPADLTIQLVWKKEWECKDVPNKHLVSDLALPVPGINLPRKQWTTLNRFRTGQGHAWPAFTNGAAAQPHCVLVESSKQCITSLK